MIASTVIATQPSTDLNVIFYFNKLPLRVCSQGLRLDFAHKFREALRPPRPEYQHARENQSPVKWLTIRRDIRVLYNQDPEPSENPE